MSKFWKNVLTIILAALGTLLGGTAVYNDLQATEAPVSYEATDSPSKLQPGYTWEYEFLAVLQLKAKTPGGGVRSVPYNREHVFTFKTRVSQPSQKEVMYAGKETLDKLPDSPEVTSYKLYLMQRRAVSGKSEETPEKDELSKE